ncbi:uncharacterized protein LOC129180098 isoform X2 [Dunckerocampus dactyliophorus]|uniref:uncharacterized protein LOC129180098 isoform X2 n=1 Tax=Dunckerocampus dactyliophorus TaxID=161453 RepID=UPI002405B32A|nr:uncharacterized protein LOC129180098 isoform X2 [Dunckerocampus dactyliophorus]
MFVHFCLGLLALSSVAVASDPTCEELVVPLQDRNLVTGKWTYHVGTADFLDDLKSVTSSVIELTLIPNSNDFTLRWRDKIDGTCYYQSVTSTSVILNVDGHEHGGKFLKTCPDCLLWIDDTVVRTPDGEPQRNRHLFLFTKSGTLDAAHLKAVKKQAACLNFTQDLHFGNSTAAEGSAVRPTRLSRTRLDHPLPAPVPPLTSPSWDAALGRSRCPGDLAEDPITATADDDTSRGNRRATVGATSS